MINRYRPKYKNEKSVDRFEKIKEEVRQKFEKEHTFKPQIDYNFTNRERVDENRDELYRRLSVPKTLESNKRQILKQQQDLEKMSQECTFQPNINTKFVKESIAPAPERVTSRLYKLAEQLKEKREKLKREHQEDIQSSYTFTPVIGENSKQMMLKYDNRPLHQRVKIKF